MLARWLPGAARAELVELPQICRRGEVDDPVLAPRVIPTATQLQPPSDLWTHLGQHPLLARRVLWGRWGTIGQPAVDRNLASPSPAFVPGFKRHLGPASLAVLARSGDTTWTARDVARVFLRELIAEAARATGERIRDLVITVPVEAYESYRAELSAIARHLGVTRLRFLDEPLAAALGYGLSARARRRVLVVDFGAGTLHFAVAELSGHDVERGNARVLAKLGRAVGGDHVDDWLVDDVVARLGVRQPPDPFWRERMREEARRVKELTYARGRAAFHVLPPEHIREARARGLGTELSVDQPHLRALLQARGLFDLLQGALDELGRSVDVDGVDEVLMVGGSTLLPGVFPLFEARFGRDRVRAFRPFEAVALGAAAFAGGALLESDHIVHDYAVLTWHPITGEPRHVTVIPSGTRVPTRPDLWRQPLVPTCALGQPETFFKLVICEIGHGREDERLLGWDTAGEVHVLDGERRLVVPLNAANPALGALDPPHEPGDCAPRLDVSFGVNADRWLIVTVRDLKSGRVLMDARPVVRLL